MSTIYSLVLKRSARITALQDPSTIQGKRYSNGLDNSIRPLGFADGRPYRGHKGIDLGVGVGTAVYAPFNGSVWTTWTDSGGYRAVVTAGNIKIGFNHLSNFVVSRGTIKKGDLLAYSGNSGYATTGAHLHVDVFTVDGQCLDCFPFVTGAWTPTDQTATGVVAEQTVPNTDQYEYQLNQPITYMVDTNTDKEPLNVRQTPSVLSAVVGAVKFGTVFAIDKRCDLPSGELWGRLEGQPWHWVCLCDGKRWLVADPPEPAHRYYFEPPKVYQPVESIQGYSEPEWSGSFQLIAFKGTAVVIVERYDTVDGLKFGKSEDDIWYLLFSEKHGWTVRGGWYVTDEFTAVVSGGLTIKGGYYYVASQNGEIYSPTGNKLKRVFR